MREDEQKLIILRSNSLPLFRSYKETFKSYFHILLYPKILINLVPLGKHNHITENIKVLSKNSPVLFLNSKYQAFS